MSGYRLSVEPTGDGEDEKAYRVQYTLPGLGFGCMAVVSESTAELLKVAVEEGKNQARAEIRAALGLK